MTQYKMIILYIKAFLIISLILIIIYFLDVAMSGFGIGSRTLFNLNKCLNIEHQSNNTFTYDVSQDSISGLSSVNKYLDIGQSIDWIDTGFLTNGDNLIINVTGQWLPWPENLIGKNSTQETVPKLDTKTSTMIESIDEDEKYIECNFNTDNRTNHNNMESNTIIKNSILFLEQYTINNQINQDIIDTIELNNNLNTQYKEEYKESLTKSNCTIGLNCELENTSQGEFIPCAMKSGAGVYIKIGDAEYAYHIINHKIPTVETRCETNNNCTFKYKTDNNGDIIYKTIPFSLPTQLSNFMSSNGTLIDISQSKNNLSTIEHLIDLGAIETLDYDFLGYKLEGDSTHNTCINDSSRLKTDIINGFCYLNTTFKILNGEFKGYSCPLTNISHINYLHPNELCPPVKNQKIYVKHATTSYIDSYGKVSLSFSSGADNISSTVISDQHLGPLSNMLKAILYYIITPFWGNQKITKIKDVLTINTTGSDINHKGQFIIKGATGTNINIFLYGNKNDLIVSPFGSNKDGIVIKGAMNVIHGSWNEFTSKINSITSISGTTNQVLTLTLSKNSQFEITDFDISYIENSGFNLINFSDRYNSKAIFFGKNNGKPTSIRQAILTNHLFQIGRILLIVWIVMSVGLDYLFGTNRISNLKNLKDEIIRLFLLLYVTDAANYELFDEIVLNICFEGFLSLAAIFFEAANNMFGMSIPSTGVLDYFGYIIDSIISIPMAIRIMSLGTIEYFFMFPLLLAILWFSLKPFIIGIIFNVYSLILLSLTIGFFISMFPFFALVSILRQYSGTMTKALSTIKDEFINLAATIGTYGFLSGFAVSYFYKAMSFEVCNDKLFNIIVSFYGWRAKSINFFELMINLFIFFLCVMILNKVNEKLGPLISQMFGGKSTLGFSMSEGSKMFNSMTNNVINGITNMIHNIQDIQKTIKTTIINQQQIKTLLQQRSKQKILQQEQRQQQSILKQQHNKLQSLQRPIIRVNNNIQKQSNSILGPSSHIPQNKEQSILSNLDKNISNKTNEINKLRQILGSYNSKYDIFNKNGRQAYIDRIRTLEKEITNDKKKKQDIIKEQSVNRLNNTVQSGVSTNLESGIGAGVDSGAIGKNVDSGQIGTGMKSGIQNPLDASQNNNNKTEVQQKQEEMKKQQENQKKTGEKLEKVDRVFKEYQDHKD